MHILRLPPGSRVMSTRASEAEVGGTKADALSMLSAREKLHTVHDVSRARSDGGQVRTQAGSVDLRRFGRLQPWRRS